MIDNVIYEIFKKVCFNLSESKTRYLYGVVRRGLAAEQYGGRHERS